MPKVSYQRSWRTDCMLLLAKARASQADWYVRYPKFAERCETLVNSDGNVTQEQLQVVLDECKALLGAKEVKKEE